MRTRFAVLLLAMIFSQNLWAGPSVFKQKPRDPDAVYFTPTGGDVTESLQKAINDLKDRDNMGIIYIAPGTYTMSGTIFVPPSIRLIGYGEQRPVFVLKKNSPGFDQQYPEDGGNAKYMFWFISNMVKDGIEPAEATSATFYQAFENIDVKVEDGNPSAVIFRTHYAQHSFIEHCELWIGKGKAGVYEVGNEMEDVIFHGGDHGIYTGKTSPGWQMTIVNTVFDGQRVSAIRTKEAGMTLVRVTMKNAPVGLEVWPGFTEKAYLQDCTMENIKDAAIVETSILTATNQLNVKNVVCRNTPTFLKFNEGDSRTIPGQGKIYQVNDAAMGLVLASADAEGEMILSADITPLAKMPEAPVNDIPALPDMSTWTYATDFGAVGDGETDNTAALQKLIDEHEVIFLPQGQYRISETLTLKPDTKIIGMDPVSTRIFIKEGTPAFSGWGDPKPLMIAPKGGHNVLSGFSISVSGFNYRAVALKWMAGEDSYVNDVMFTSGVSRKGPARMSATQEMQNVTKRARIMDKGLEETYDNQHWSLWITNGGGGVFKDVWINNSLSSAGLVIENTSTPGKIYEMSVEHHVRNEVVIRNAANWNILALQLEQETREGSDIIPMEIHDSHDINFANFYAFRVISIVRPQLYTVKTWNSRDINFFNFHNFTQMRFTTNTSVYDVNSGNKVKPWEFTRLCISGKEAAQPIAKVDGLELLANGFEYAEGIATDSKGNVFFSEERLKKVYMWDAAQQKLRMLSDLPWQPISLGVDTEDRLLVTVKFYPQPESSAAPAPGAPRPAPDLSTLTPDSKGTTFAWWGNFGFLSMVYSIDPADPYASLKTLVPVKTRPAAPAKTYYATHRWRDLYDFDEVAMYRPEGTFVALDGKTIIPQQYDLVRSSSMVPAVAGKPFYQVDEFSHLTKQFDVAADGSLSNPRVFAHRGERGYAVDARGNVYIGEGDILVFSPSGEHIRTIRTPEGACSLACVGDYLYFTTRDSLYRVKI